MITITRKSIPKEIMVMSRTSPWSVFRRSALRCDGIRDDITFNKAAQSLPKNPGGRIVAAEGQFNLAAAVNAVNNLTLEGQGESTVFNLTTVGQNGIVIASKSGVSLRGFKIETSVVKTGGAAIRVAEGLTSIPTLIEHIAIDDQHHGIDLAGGTVIHIHHIRIRNTIHTVIEVDGGNDQYLSEIVANNPAGSQPTYGLHLKNTQAIWITDCDFIHCGYGFLARPPTGSLVNWGFIKGLAVDKGDQIGMYFTESEGGTVKGLTFTNCWSGSNSREGVYIAGGKGIRFIGHKSIQNDSNGFVFAGGSDNALEDSDIWDNDKDNSGDHGVAVDVGVSGFTIEGNRIGNVEGVGSQRYGIIVLAGASNNYIIMGNDCRGNVTGGISDGGAGATKEVAHNIPSAGQHVRKVVWKSTADRALADLNRTVSSGWTDLDLTGYTSPNAKQVILKLRVHTDSYTNGRLYMQVRKNGEDPGNYPEMEHHNPANTSVYPTCIVICGVDSGQVLEYRLHVAGTAQADFYIDVVGYIE